MGANEAMNDGDLCYLPVESVVGRKGFNPRRYFDAGKMTELVESVRVSGIIQPIVVRAIQDGHYEIIAGERRVRAAREVGLRDIPAVIRAVSEVEAVAISLVENTHRDDLGPSEEARKARDYLTVCEGDRDEVCRRLGWTARMLESRLSLLNCTDAVLDALDERKISIGHGELLSGLPEVTQNGTLPKLIEQKISVEALRERIQGIARRLDKALFDTTDCNGCGSNSNIQASLFDAHIGIGKCSNPKCYGEKQIAALEGVKAKLTETYAAVWLDTERSPDTYCVLEKGGPDGVGVLQYETGCQQCAKFGAVVSTAAGREGAVKEDVCFDPGCRKEKTAAFKASQVPVGEPTHANDDSDPVRVGGAGAGGPAPKAPKANVATAKVATGTTPKKVGDEIDKRLAAVAGDLAVEDPRVTRAVRLYAIWKEAGFPKQESLGCPELGGVAACKERSVAAFIGFAPEVCERIERVLASHVLKVESVINGSEAWAKTARSVIKTTATDLSGRVRVDAEFLRAHQKAGMVALLREAGFDKWYDKKHGEARFARLCSGKIDDIVHAAVEKNGFDWSGFVPAVVRDRMKLHG